jgi:hypothetical protein
MACGMVHFDPRGYLLAVSLSWITAGKQLGACLPGGTPTMNFKLSIAEQLRKGFPQLTQDGGAGLRPQL